jgi:MFS family permease
MVGFGAIYSYAAFADQITADFAADRGSTAFVYALAAGGCFFVSALSGRLADRVGARPLAAAGMVLVATGFLVAASASTLLQVLLGYGLLVGLGAGAAYVPAVALVQRWFVADRGLASGLAVSGIGVATALVPSLGGALQDAIGWRGGFIVLSFAALAIGLVGAALLRPPAAPPMGALAPDAIPAQRGLGTIWVGSLLMSLGPALPFAFLAATAQDAGLSRSASLALLGTLGIGTIVGRFLIPALGDVIGRRRVFLSCSAVEAFSLLGWAAAHDEASLQGFAFLFGLLHGGVVALLPAVLADRFGPWRIGGTIGAVYTARGAAFLVAPIGFGIGTAAFGGAALPLAVVCGLGLLGTWLLARE